jgi:homoserine kinase
LAAELEGHPDNAAPALIGGLVLSKKTRQKVGWTKLSCHPDIRVLLFIPDFRLSTSQARQVLPDSIPHRDAVANTASFGFLLEGIRTGRKELLAQGNEDYLHQEYRRPLVEDYDAVERAALAVGCSVLALSGAGPSLVGLLIGSQSEAEEKRIQIQNMLSANWQAKSLAIDEEGMVFMGEDRN